uniref:Uncharacterized protein n=1 Tax=Arundo donax TaxID=35708 RepID=A0A0A8ZLI4_ARUDO
MVEAFVEFNAASFGQQRWWWN